MPQDRISLAIDYIADHPEIRDVLLSGGDALLVSDEILEDIIQRLRVITSYSIHYTKLYDNLESMLLGK